LSRLITKEFSWDDVYARRAAFAKSVQQDLGLSFALTAGIKEPFSCPPLNAEFFADQPLWRIPFYIIGARLDGASRVRAIDHAWWLIADDRSGEPWGFVTEPYQELVEANRIARDVRRKVQSWGITIRVLAKTDSTWNPGSTVPIVVTASVGGFRELLYGGLRAATEILKHGPI
jgi:hypothetical protein